jgi:hypothetical protein
MSENYPLRDVMGTQIVPHCLIVYALSFGSSVRLHWGRVERTTSKGAVTFQTYERWGTPPKLRDRLTTLHSPENTIVVPWSQAVPDVVRRVLDPEGEHARALNQEPPPPTTGGIVS